MVGVAQAQDSNAENESIEEIVVTGSYIKRRLQADSSSPILIMDSEQLEAQGIVTPEQLVNTLTINTGAQIYANHLEQGRNAGTTNFNLRGLGESSTLVLLNGTRQTLTPAVNLDGDQYVNLSTLVPMIAVERVEILKDGASAIYGSDAVAGVVNFITRDNFEGLEVRLGAANNEFGADGTSFGIILGGAYDRGNFMGAFEYREVDPVTNLERNDDYNATRNSITGFGMPSTIVSFGEGVILPDPMCNAVGATLPPGQVFEAFLCRLTYGQFGNVVSEEQRLQAFVSADYAFGDSAEFFGEMSWANNQSIIGSVPTQPVTNPVYVPEDHPDLVIFAQGDPDPYANVNRINADGLREVQWWGRILGGGSPQNNDLKPFENWRMKGGIRGDINDQWDYTLSYAYSIEETSAFRRESILINLQQALYGRGGANRDEWYHFAWDNRGLNSQGIMEDIIGFYGYDAQSTQKVLDGIVSTTELFQIGGRSAGAAFGFQVREDTLAYDYNDMSEKFVFSFFIGGADFAVDQDSTAVFGEVALPLSDNLDVNLAVRYQKIDDETTTDPKLSLLWSATDTLSLRASIGTSFRMPSLFTKGGSFFDAGSGTDPVVGFGITYRAEFATDPLNPVQPQEATNYNIGGTYANPNGLEISLDYWNFDYDGFIAYESTSSVLATDPLGPQVLRDPSGNVIQVTGYARNAGFLKTDGIDWDFRWVVDSGAGTWTPFWEGTYMLSYDIDDPQWGPTDALGVRNYHNIGAPAVELRFNAGVLWAKDNHSANVIARYIDGYMSDESDARLGGPITDGAGNLDPANYIPVDSMTVIDAQYSYVFENSFGGDTETILRIGARNLAGEVAPPAWGTSGYDERVHDPRGRYWYVNLAVKFN